MNELRKIVRQRRTEQGKTQSQLAVAVQVSASLIAHIEQGKLVPQPDTAIRLDEALGAGGEVVSAANRAREDAAAPWLRPWADHEENATLIRTFHPNLVPGLLQTEAYARAILAVGPHSAEQVDEMTATRLSRQAATLNRATPVTLSAVMGEPALRCGDPIVLAGQIRHLVKLAERPEVTIRVIPMTAGFHPGLTGAFALAALGERRTVGYVDDQLRGRVVADGADAYVLGWTWEAISTRALPPALTQELMTRIADDLANDA